MNRYELAGLISTLGFVPADHHHEACLPMADQILAWWAEEDKSEQSDQSLAATGDLTVEDVARGLAALRDNDHYDPVVSPSEVPRKYPAPPQEGSQKCAESMWDL